jgi:hypothetical protein
VLIQSGRNPGPLNQSIPTFTFDSRLIPASTPTGASEQNGPFSKFANTTGFYRMQLSVNWSF